MSKSQQNNLYAISGVKGSGKDLSSDILQYCLSVPKMFRQYWIYNIFDKLFPKKYKKIAFADPLKKMLSVLLNIPFDNFNNRNFKEDCIINIATLDYSLSAFSNEEDQLSDSKFNRLAKNLDPLLTQSNLTIRQLMQYFGTEVMRKFFGENVWINSTLKHASKNTIITDLRFKSEYNAVKSKGATVIFINRPGYTFGQHASEREMEDLLINNKYDVVINNNGSVKDLFDKIKNICNEN